MTADMRLGGSIAVVRMAGGDWRLGMLVREPVDRWTDAPMPLVRGIRAGGIAKRYDYEKRRRRRREEEREVIEWSR